MTQKSINMLFIVTVVAMNVLGVGIIWPVLPNLIEQMVGGTVSSGAYYYAIIGILYAGAQFVFSPLIGSLSDRFGRRPILIVSQMGLALDYLLTAFAPTLIWLAFARLIGGVLGATMSAANAYMTDISEPEERARHFGYLGAAFGVGFIAGPLIGGLLGAHDLRLPFIVAAIICSLNALFGIFFVKESLPQKDRRAFDKATINPFHSLIRVARFPALKALFTTFFLTAVGQRGLESVWVLFTQFRFGWSITQASLSLAYVGFVSVVAQTLIVGPLVKRFGEYQMMVFGFALSVVSLFAYALATEEALVYVLITFHVLGNALSNPTLQSLSANRVAADSQGLLQGVFGSLNSIAIIIGPFAASMILSHVSGPNPIVNMPGAWFIICAMFYSVGLYVSFSARAQLYPKSL